MTSLLDPAARAAAEVRATARQITEGTKIMSFTEPSLTSRHPGLTNRDVQILDIARDLATIPDGTGRREQYIATTFGASSTAFYQHLNRLLDSQAALAAYPVLINRLRRIRDARNTQRGH